MSILAAYSELLTQKEAGLLTEALETGAQSAKAPAKALSAASSPPKPTVIALPPEPTVTAPPPKKPGMEFRVGGASTPPLPQSYIDRLLGRKPPPAPGPLAAHLEILRKGEVTPSPRRGVSPTARVRSQASTRVVPRTSSAMWQTPRGQIVGGSKPGPGLFSQGMKAVSNLHPLAKGALGAGAVGAAGLGAYGLYRATRPSQGREARASAIEYSELFDKAASGEMGADVQAALSGICVAYDRRLDYGSSVVEKSAAAPCEETSEDSRKRRLAELLKKREPTGTATGSASPHPPKGE